MNEAALRHSSHVELLSYQPKSRMGEPLAPRGSVVVYLAVHDSKALRALRSAVHSHALGTGLLEGIDKTDSDGLQVTIRHGDMVLAQDVPVPRDGRAVRLIMPYTGGKFEATGITLEGEGVSAFGVVHAPPLTVGERAALSLIPESMLALNLGVALAGGIAATNDEERRRQQEEQRQANQEAAAERAQQRAEAQAAAAEARAEARAERRAGGSLEVHLLESTLGVISPVLSASAMLEIRRSVVLNQVNIGG